MTTPARTISTVLQGCTVLLPVDRRSGELSAALERHGARVRVAPALTIVPHVDDDELIAQTRQLVADPPDVVVATTGVGFRAWMETADEAGVHDELATVLHRARIVARGPKARGAIQQAGFEADWVAESETAAELRDFLVAEGLDGLHIAVQHHGSGADGLDEAFEAAGARVMSLTIYRWGPPPDPEVVAASTRQVARGEIDAVLFTSAPAAREWLLAAERAEALEGVASRARNGHVLVAAVGPITAAPLIEAGIDPLVPDRGRLGALVRAVVTHYGGVDARVIPTTSGQLGIRSSGIVVDGVLTPLPRTGVEIFRALARVPGAVVSRADLVAALSSAESSGHAVEVAVARTRDALGDLDLIRTVYKRGYRIDVIDEEDR
ncbi:MULTISPECIES: uroporphyrinogen-III synthase [unclassified Microbacterium]|uniref:uroporphyrinogen-III synthase n=1 Tax=unclassified Microbacterium TaxID=2609290 RepID=UPI001781253F|nr:uroporphyrinogen-III synthase [Microbacterium sp. CFBP 8801]MBD8478361.1 uroporphyrinogen-III synthase [Microbacterium sp. CFBP 8794]MBD8508365.1 uroporphyrinogen-III synthase [Microbacterium sp. CFBP 8790]